MFTKVYSKTATLKKTKKGFQDGLSLNAGQKYCRMLQREHSATLLTFIKLPVVIKIFVGAQWLRGRVLDSRPRDPGFKPHRRHYVVVLEQDTFILA